jgi:chemotaxis protein MotB
LREQLARLNDILDAADAQNKQQQVQIADLGRRLNIALASKVQELARYRSEFFGRLRQVLGEHPDIQIVGDRFVFQSEVLFETGSAELGEEGRVQMARLARTLLDISKEIPAELDWVLRVDGHTDNRPISTAQFPSNWELSTARAISVVKFLIEQGLPPSRVAATGFGEFQPIDPDDDEIAYRRNRRIELKLTQR